MNPPCARCGKIVYPTEKVSCLDKVGTFLWGQIRRFCVLNKMMKTVEHTEMRVNWRWVT